MYAKEDYWLIKKAKNLFDSQLQILDIFSKNNLKYKIKDIDGNITPLFYSELVGQAVVGVSHVSQETDI